MKPMRLLALFIWLIICVGGLTALNIADEYRDRGASAVKTNIAVETVNGDSVDYANLQAAKQAESSSRMLFGLGRVAFVIVLVGGSYYIIRPVIQEMKQKEEDAV